MSLLYPSLFRGPPRIPSGLSELATYKLETNAYYKKIKNVTFIFIEIIATLLVLGIIWINIDWVKIVVTVIAISLALILLYVLNRIFF